MNHRPPACVSCKDRPANSRVRGYLAASIALTVWMTGFAAAAQQKKSPNDRLVDQTVDAFFSTVPGYQKGDLITRSQIEKVLAELKAAGVEVKGAKEIAAQGVADDSFLAREFSTAEGKRFMRKVGQDAGGFVRLDRLASIPHGQATVRDLARQKDGDKLIEYLATTKGGRNMGSMMAGARGGADLNKPTGRIYTAEDLVTAVKNSLATTKP